MLLEGIGILLFLPNSQVFGSGCENIFASAFLVWDPHNLGGRELVLKFIDLLEAVVGFVKTEVNDVDLVVHAVRVVAAHGHLELVVFSGPEGNRVVLKITLVSINLLSHTIFGERVNLILYFLHLFTCLRISHHHIVYCLIVI